MIHQIITNTNSGYTTSFLESVKPWMFVSLIIWLLGYFSSQLRADSQFVEVPTWLFYLCGLPRLRGFPSRILTRSGASLQILSFLFFLLAACFHFLISDTYPRMFVVFWASLICAVIINKSLLSKLLFIPSSTNSTSPILIDYTLNNSEERTYKTIFRWRLITIFSSFGLAFGLLLPFIFSKKDSGNASIFIWLSAAMFIIAVIATYDVLKSRIIISPMGIEYLTIGFHCQASWDKVEKISVRSVGYFTLLFKESICRGHFAAKILNAIGADRSIELTSFISDPHTSPLLKDIKFYAPDCDMPKFES